jgi:ATP-dependent Clp protease ATP-binding subunit ClpC
MSPTIDLHSLRARKARTGQRVGKSGFDLLLVFVLLFLLAAIYFLFFSANNLHRIGYAAAGLMIFTGMVALWYHFDLAKPAPSPNPTRLDDIMTPAFLAHLTPPLTPKHVWEIATRDFSTHFLCEHLFVHPDAIYASLSDKEADMDLVWRQAIALRGANKDLELWPGTVAAAMIVTTPALQPMLTQLKLDANDVIAVHEWLLRQLRFMNRHKMYYGGIGRDWTSGFTPNLDHFGQNISQAIQASGGYSPVIAHESMLDGLVNTLANGSAVALVGETGVGKTSLVRALAERLLDGGNQTLQYYRVIALSASMIVSAGGSQLEPLLLTLFGEAVHAGNTIIFLDDAQLFFGRGLGAFDMGQLLAPLLGNRRIRLIAAFTPQDWQRLRGTNEVLANGFAVTMVDQPDAATTLRVLEDEAMLFENRYKVLITYEALREAVRLSGQYMQEEPYPGKAVSLVEQSVSYAQDQVVMAETIQHALEKMRGVRVSAAAAPEADMLLHLEDQIHQRMINQTQAVGVVAAALRRGRAGVSNPKRPVGSFLFLGPTGVGKTELARSLAAVYFGDEHQMIRLDMSEYQQPSDVGRLLSSGKQGDRSLLLAIRQQPFSVVLLDEVEKAHPNILNLLLQMLDEGQLTDDAGKPASFRSAIIIATSNAGAADIMQQVRATGSVENFERPLVDKLITSGQFRPELINRFDEVVLFRPLNQSELAQIASLMLGEVNKTLAAQNIQVQLTDAALQELARNGYDPEFGARPMRRMIQKTVENAVAVKILSKQAQAGATITLDVADLQQTSQSQQQQQQPARPIPWTPNQTPPQ